VRPGVHVDHFRPRAVDRAVPAAAERSQYSAEDSLLQSRIAIATDYIALAKALGGGWDGAIDSSRPEVIDVNTGPHIAASQPSGQDDPSASDARTSNP
jgi:hypothetical protein